MKVYITENALTVGIIEAKAELVCEGVVYVPSELASYGKPDWHTHLNDAVARAEYLQQIGIAALEATIKRIKALRFE
jgi:hypothetical protein